MNKNSRSKNSRKNIILGCIFQVIITIISFATRIIFVRILDTEYLGINGLYSSILSILAMAELGIGNVLIFSLYKPILNNDYDEIKCLLNYYKKIYRVIALAITIIGISIIPVLHFIVKSNLSQNELITYYILYLLNSVVSYFVIYKTALINADQKVYIVKFVNMGFILAQNIVQIFVLYFTKNYFLYLLVRLFCTIFNNLILNFIANRLYPFIKSKTSQILNREEINKLKTNIKATFLYKISVVIINSTDNILISIICGTIFVGYFSNYTLIITSVTTFAGIVINSIIPSLGNLNAEKNKEKSFEMFNNLLLFFAILATFASGCMLAIFSDFVSIFFGKQYLLDNFILGAIVLNFYLTNIINPVWMYRETLGLFNQIKTIILISAGLNLIFSVILGNLFGMAGILYATSISRLLSIVWYEPRLLYKTIFKKELNLYWLKQAKYVFTAVLDFVLIYYICSFFQNVSYLGMILKVIIVGIIVGSSYFITNFKSKELSKMKHIILN